MLRHRLAAAAVAAAFVGGIPTVATSSEAATNRPVASAAKSCRAGYPHAVLRDGRHVCLHAGEFCSRTNQHVYRTKGFTCRGGRLRSR